MMNQSNPSVWAPRLNGIMRVFAFLTLILILTPVQIYCRRRRATDSRRIPLIFHRLLTRVLGFTLRVHGAMATTAPVMYVANHTSYLDIPVLGALIPAAFVAKSEVAQWPFFGPLAKLQQTVFVERKITRAGEQSDVLSDKLQKGQSLILFPEGTSSIGLSVLPFKSSLFSIVQGDFPKPVLVQPVSIVCTGLDGMPLTRDLRSLYAWYGDMTLMGHLWNVFKTGRFTVDVIFHAPVSPGDFPDRKLLSAYCQSQVGRGIEQCLTGRLLVGVTAMPQLAAPETATVTAAKI